MKTIFAGPLRLRYENGFLRQIAYNGVEVIRMIYFALRDQNWNTVRHQIENENIAIDDDRFKINYECFHLDGGVTVMEWRADISGDADGTVTFEIRGNALEDFKRNRAGFCLLHPLNLAGTGCSLVHDDGTASERSFPLAVAPDNPFRRIRSMTWMSAGHQFSVTFEGDVFETEDQRNWGDASFKTFCTPLDQPFPVQLRNGDKVFQRIVVRPVVTPPGLTREDTTIDLQRTGRYGVIPLLGIGASTELERIPEELLAPIREMRLRHYRVDLYPGSERFAFDFSREYENSFALGLPLEVVLHLTDNYPEEMEAFTVICKQNKVRLRNVLLLTDGEPVTAQKVIDELIPLKAAFPRVLFGGGTNYNFNEINKNRFIPNNLDYISFSMDPQEHASDDITILENTATPEHLVHSAKGVYGADIPVHISPLTLRKRFNPYAANPSDRLISEWAKADPRQKEVLGALWTFGAICSAAKGKASAMTLYQTVGNQGIVSAEGVRYPLYDAFRLFTPFQGRRAEILESSDPLSLTAIVLDGTVLAVANMTSQDKRIHWNGKELQLSPWEIRTESL